MAQQGSVSTPLQEDQQWSCTCQSPEACRLLQDFNRNFTNDPKVKIPWVRQDLCGPRVLTMEWIDGLRCTDPRAIVSSGINVEEFIRGGVVTGLRQLLEVGGAPGLSCWLWHQYCVQGWQGWLLLFCCQVEPSGQSFGHRVML